MNDLTVFSSAAHATFDRITQHLAGFTEASAGCHQILTQSQTLHEVASDLLRSRIISIGAEIGLEVINPQALFFNRLDEEGSLCSMSMTDVLIDAVREGASAEFAGAAFYTRHDSVDPMFALTTEQNRELQEILRDCVGGLSASYQEHLSALWRNELADPADPERSDSGARILIEQQRKALQNEIALCGLSARMSPAEQDHLSSVVDGSSEGVFALSWMASDGAQVPVPSVYAVSESTRDGIEPSGVVFLVMPSGGIERFESVATLRETLSQRLGGPQCDRCLMESMLLCDQPRLTNDQPIDQSAWKFEPVNDPLLNAHVQSVQHKQMEDFKYLLQREGAATDTASFHTDLERVQVCAHLDDAMGHRFNQLAIEMNELVQPRWRKFAEQADKDYLLSLEKAHHERKKKVDSLLKGTESLEDFAKGEITDYIRRHLGCFIDPDKVQITLNDTISLGNGDELKATYRKSLLEFAVQGLPEPGGRMGISPAPGQLHAAFSEDFVKRMINGLDLHRRYEAVLRQCYENEDILRALTHHRDSAIALGAWSAMMQGHMIQDRSHEMLHLIRGDQGREGVQYSLGSLYLTQTHTRFKDLIVFEEKTDSDEHFVLYAPGSPDGQDFFEFGSWRQLCFRVGKWLETASGRSYVQGQLTGSTGGRDDVLNNIQLKPSLWGADSCIFVRGAGGDFETNLSDLVRQKALRTIDSAKGPAARTSNHTSFANPSVLALMDARIAAFNGEFARLSPGLISLRDYVHQQTTSLLNDYLRSQGYTRKVDPDTLYLGLGLPYFDTPDFSARTELRTFTDLMMDGSEDIMSYRPQIHLYSSTGLDVTRLPLTLIQFMDKQIREADLGAHYMEFLTSEFLGRENPHYRRRKALMAKRVQYEMMRSALKAFLKGDLSESQYGWLRHTIAGLDKNALNSDVNKTSAVSAFKIADQIIEGVFIFRDFSKSESAYNLLYTPESPDGVNFRPLTDYADLLESTRMQSYYYGRVAYAGQPMVGTFYDELDRGKKYDPDFVRIVNRIENRIVDAHQLYGDMLERMIADADSQTESLAEKRLSLAWTIIRWTGTILLLPFPTVSFAWGILTTTVSFFRGLDAYVAGDRATALPLLVFGVLGIVSGGDAARALAAGGHTVAKEMATTSARWAWNKFELGRSFQVAV